jgi:hypothetical protein
MTLTPDEEETAPMRGAGVDIRHGARKEKPRCQSWNCSKPKGEVIQTLEVRSTSPQGLMIAQITPLGPVYSGYADPHVPSFAE